MRMAGINTCRSRQLSHQFQSIHPRHVIIDHKAARVRQAIFVQQFLGAGINAHVKAFDLQYELERISDGRVIINHKHNVFTGLRRAQLVHAICFRCSVRQDRSQST